MSIGAQLQRAELYGFDSKGKAIPAKRRDVEYPRSRETKPHALSRPAEGEDLGVGSLEEYARLVARLTPEERAVLNLQNRQQVVERERVIGITDLGEHLDQGWSLVRVGGAGIATVSREFVEATLTYGEIGARLGISARQVHRRVVSAHRKMRAAIAAL